MHRVMSVTTLALLLAPALAQADKKKEAAASGVSLNLKVSPEKGTGFVDDAWAFDGPGGRLAWVRTDASAECELNVMDLNQGGAQLAKIDLSKVTTTVVRLQFTQDGTLFVVSRPGDADAAEERATAYLYDLTGKQLRKWGPAVDVTLTNVEGVDAVTVFDKKLEKKGGTTYTVAVFKAANGKAMGKKRVLKADAAGYIKGKGLDITLLYWRNGYTQLVGQKKGDYDKYEDQRQPDNLGVYDIVDGAMIKNQPITDLVAHEKLMKLRVERSNQSSFLILADDGRALELITADDKRVRVDVSAVEKFSHYDAKTLVQEPGADGKTYFTLTIDPVNPDAVARKVADPEHIDLYSVDPASGKAERLARLPKAKVPFTWHVAGGRWGVLRKHKGYDRGGTDLEIYDLTGK